MQPSGWTLIPPPSWYDATLPKFYRAPNGEIHVFPLNAVPKYTTNNILDLLLYYQTIVGYNRFDFMGAKSAAWTSGNGTWSAKVWAQSAFQKDNRGDGSGNWANVPNDNMGTDGALYTQLQQRYIELNKSSMPWLNAMQAVGGGIDLMTIPMSTDTEVPRPSWYPQYLPSLWFSAGEPYQAPAGSLNTKPKIRNFKSSGYTQYVITPRDVASLLMYEQPVVLTGSTPYQVGWYINDNVNGPMANYFKITLAPTAFEGHTNSQMQAWGIMGNIMVLPTLDANPFASGFSQALQGIVQAVISFFAGKIPGGSTLMSAANKVAAMGGSGIFGATQPTAGTYSAAVYAAADQIADELKKKDQSKNVLLLAAAAVALAWWAHEEKYI